MNIEALEFHPAANSFPMMDAKRFEELKADIERQGQIEPITTCDGMVLDGRNRYKALSDLGIPPKIRSFDGDPWAYVWSLNGERRDLVAEQRYLIWKFCHKKGEAFLAEKRRIAEEANRKRSEAMQGIPYAPKGGERKEKVVHHSDALLSEEPTPKPNAHKGAASKSKASKTNPGAVQRGDQLDEKRPDLSEKVRTGEMKPSEAHRQMKRDSVSEKVAALPSDKYRIIYADPPWAYNDKQSGSISESYGAAEKHYPSMSISELKALDIRSMTHDDAALFLWATSPLLPEALDVLSAWGFRYKASFIWDKVRHNMGHYNSVRHEFLLIATKGSCTPENVELFDSVQSIERTKKHSEKPEEFRDIIDTLYPSGKRVELFARKQVNGWDTWGNESND
jgi:N6-adenosine-specific RNA methylase IME4